MSAARKVGLGLGRAVGFVGATAWKGTVVIAGAAGEAGQGFVDGASSGWDDRCAVMDARIEEARAKRAAMKLAFEAQREAKTTMVAA